MSEMKHNVVQPSKDNAASSRSLYMTSETFAMHKDNMQLRQARWASHRKKIGLNYTNESATQQLMQNSYDKVKQDLIKFVKSSFRRKECVKFVPKHDAKRERNDPIKCYCGERPERHTDGAEGVKEFFRLGAPAVTKMLEKGEMTRTWNKDVDIEEFKTNAFGKIDFQYEGLGGRKPSKYVRLKDDTPVELVLNLFEHYWHMDRPRPANLVITVIGGAKNFKLDGKKKEIFNRGLVNAAQTTNAWIITSGCNMGVMRAVGEAVAEAQSYTYDQNGMTHTLRCIGIAPWGYVLDSDPLVKLDGNGSWNATYKPSKVIRHGSPVSLNPNHTHFLLVDDGHRGVYGGVADFRARLESKLALPVKPAPGEDPGCGIPVVLVVVEGGYDAIMDVSRSIKARIPCVICEGTGRAADILAYAYLHFVTTRDGKRVMKDNHQLVLEDKLISAYGKTWMARSDVKKEAAKFLKIVMDSCQDENLMTVFDMNKNEEMDLAILSALLKGQGAKNLDQLHDQLRLALTWNRTDIAEEEIFTLDINWPCGSLNDIMTDALVDDKVGFVRLLLQNGLIMEEYLTAPKLRMLYNKIPKTHHLREMLQRKTKYHFFTLKDIGRLIAELLDKFNNTTYALDTDVKAISHNVEASLGVSEDKLDNPFKELFLWAILMNRQELAKFLWERGNEAIPSAIAASKMYESMTKRLADYDSDLRSTYKKNKDEFEYLAVKVLDECNNMDPEKAAMLIEQKYSGWGNMDCLEMAAQAEDRIFLSTVCCQNSLSLMWKRGISSHSALVPFCLLFPPLIFLLLRFQSLGDKNEKLTARQKLLTFFHAPVTKFTAHLMMYLVFLGLYSYMLLFGYRVHVTPYEWAVIAWLVTISIEEFREMFLNTMADSVKQRLHIWWNFSVFNRVNALVIALAILTVVLRFTPNLPIIYAKNVYSIMGVFLFVRILREYSASSSLGPKLVMINQMLKELILFMMILLVFLLAYGISSQALMHPIREPSSLVFRDILYYPYWQVYGELYLDELEGRTDDCRNSTINADGDLCPTFSWLVIILTAGYLLVGNLLLLNILIAIFNNVFNEIHTNSIQIWKYGMYFLVVEYDNKPALAPPFIVFEHIFMIFRWIFRRTCCKKQELEDTSEIHYLEFTLGIFEKECLKEFLSKDQVSEQELLPKRLAFIYDRVDEMAKMLEEERLLEQQHFEAEQNRQTEKSPSHQIGHHNQPSISSVSISSSDGDITWLDPPRKYSRWPSLQTIKALKARMEGLQAIQEDQSGQAELGAILGTAVGVTGTQQSTPEDTGRYSTSPDQTVHVTGYTESDTDSHQQYSARRGRRFSAEKHQIIIPDTEPAIYRSTEGHTPDETDLIQSPKRRNKARRRLSKKSLEGALTSGGRGYQELSEESTSSEQDLLKLSPVHCAIAERNLSQLPSPREIQANTEEVKTKLHNLDQRLAKLEDSTQKSLSNIETLLRNALFQRGPIQLVAPPPPEQSSVSVSHVPISVPQTVLPSSAYCNPDGTDYITHPLRSPWRVAADSMSVPRPQPASYDPRTIPHVNANAVPPTYPPTNAFGSFDSVL